MSERFFVSQLGDSTRPVLDEDEVRHLAVMRAQVGDELILFDGSGCQWRARIVSLSKRRAEVELLERQAIDRELPISLMLAAALPKGDRQKWLVEKATELGVTRLVPLVTERGVAQPVEAALVRLRRVVIEASKQCGRNRLMEIANPSPTPTFWAENSTGLGTELGAAPLCLLADPEGQPLTQIVRPARAPLMIAVGPEGGFTPAEVAAAAAAGWQRVSLGPRILRVETAAIALAAWGAGG
jgi:16S rRNA (uracil1498-N3)-methyltransferase